MDTFSINRQTLKTVVEDNRVNSSQVEQNLHNAVENIVEGEMFSTRAHASHSAAHKSWSVSQRVFPPEKMDSRTDVLPRHNQVVTFSAGPRFQGQISLSSSGVDSQAARETPPKDFIPVGQLLRPRSPTEQCSIPETDNSHIGLALMESKVGSQASEQIFHVRQHELICAISSQTSFVNNEGFVVSSVDISYYWCNFCTFSTATKTLLMQHMMEHRFHCRFCCYQSFSRADVIHHSAHTHPDFKETAAATQYCTLLSDYLRMQHPKEHQLDDQRKRKSPSDGDNDSGLSAQKVVKTGHGSGTPTVENKYGEDYVIFSVNVGDKEQVMVEEDNPVQETGRSSSPPPLEEVREVESPKSLENSCASSSSVTSQHSDSTLLLPHSTPAPDSSDQMPLSHGFSSVPPTRQTSSESVFPPDLMPEALPPHSFQPPASCSSSSGLSCTSRTTTPSPPNLSSVGSGSMQQGASQWICVYCSFSCASQNGIKRHCLRRHRGQPFKCISPCELDERSAPPLLRYDDGKISCPAVDKGCEIASLEEAFSVTGTMSVAEQEPAETCGSEEPPVLIKQKSVDVSVSVDTVHASIPTLHTPVESTTDLQCFHCLYRSHFLADIRNHIFSHHKGKSLNGLDAKNSTVFICSKSDCNFTSSSGQSFLNHAQECIPWPNPKPTDFLEKSVFECLQATTRLAEHNMLSSAISSATASCKENPTQFSCIYCKNEFIANKEETKQHVLDCHSAKCLYIRNVLAHRKRRKSSLYFCRWCIWEGERKSDHDLHAVFCPHQSKHGVISFGPAATKKEKDSIVVPNSDADNVCLEQTEHAAEGNCVDDDLMPPVTTTSEKNAETTGCTVSNQCDVLLETQTVPHPNTADDFQPPVNMVHEEDMQEAINLDDLCTAEDSLGTVDQLTTSKEVLDLKASSAGASVASSDMCQTDVHASNADAEKDMHSTQLCPRNSNPVDNNVCPPDLLPDSRSSGNGSEILDIQPVFDSCNNSVKTDTLPDVDFLKNSPEMDDMMDTDLFIDRVKTEASHTCSDFNASTSIEHPDHIFPGMSAAEKCEFLPNITSAKNPSGEGMLQSIAPPSVSSFENKMCLSSAPLINVSDCLNCMSTDLNAADSKHIVSPRETAPVNNVVKKGMNATGAPLDMDTAADSLYPSHTSIDIKEIVENAHPAQASDERSRTVDPLSEQRNEEEMHTSCAPPKADATHTIVEHAIKPQGHKLEAEKVPTSQGQDHNKGKHHHTKPRTSHFKKTNFWCDGHDVKCAVCNFQSVSLLSLKTHILSKHSHMVSFPFRSLYHREMHYKSSFFACPYLKCMVYNYNESDVVSHYRKTHSSLPHAYTDSSYIPAPVKSRRRNTTKTPQPSKPAKNHAQTTSQVAKVPSESTEQAYMCLYCDQNVYTDLLPDMKTHYLSKHAGQPITIRDVNAHRERRASRFFMCQQPLCDFWTYEKAILDKHVALQHSEQQAASTDRSYQCTACGEIFSDDASVQQHVSMMHGSEGGATVVTLAHEVEQQTVEERYIMCVPGMAPTQCD